MLRRLIIWIATGLLALFLLSMAAESETHGWGPHEDDWLDFLPRRAAPEVVTDGLYESDAVIKDGVGPYSILVTPHPEDSDHLATVTFQNRIVEAVRVPDEYTFLVGEDQTIIQILMDDGAGELPDTMTVIPPDGYFSIPPEVTVDEDEIGIIEIYRFVLG